MKKTSLFERYPKITLLLLFGLIGFVAIFSLEKLARYFGLGKTIVYQAHPIYGYRPLPNQLVARNQSTVVKLNNLSLRAQEDWDVHQIKNKVLFLGDSVTYGGSYITNQDLFSHIALKSFPDLIAGNGGVNAWGVDNVCALVKDMKFHPAQIIISTFPEGDFSRGLMRIGGQPFWTKPPRFALEELAHYFIYVLHNKKTSRNHYSESSLEEKRQVLALAVKHLKETDEYLKSQNRTHIIYISPSLLQLLGNEKEDAMLRSLFAEYQLQVIYIKDRLPTLAKEDYAALYHDNIHLSAKGHALWGKIMAEDLQNIYSNQFGFRLGAKPMSNRSVHPST